MMRERWLRLRWRSDTDEISFGLSRRRNRRMRFNIRGRRVRVIRFALIINRGKCFCRSSNWIRRSWRIGRIGGRGSWKEGLGGFSMARWLIRINGHICISENWWYLYERVTIWTRNRGGIGERKGMIRMRWNWWVRVDNLRFFIGGWIRRGSVLEDGWGRTVIRGSNRDGMRKIRGFFVLNGSVRGSRKIGERGRSGER
jgi:hypothetical protein